MTTAAITFVLTGPDPLRFPFWRDADFGGHRGVNASAGIANTDLATVSQMKSIPRGDTGGIDRLDTIAELPNFNHGEPSLAGAVYVAGYKAAGDGGGGILVYDSGSAEVVNGGRVFDGPPLIGRFSRPHMGEWHTRQFGIGLSGVTEGQNVDRLKQAILECQNGMSQCLVIDPDIIQFGGGEVWINPTADPYCSSAGRSFTMRGLSRRDCRLMGINLTIGKFYRIDPLTGLPIFDITRDPCGPSYFQNVHIEGCTRLVNIEGSPQVINCSFFGSPNAGFYTTPPSNWGIGDAVSRTISTPYPAYQAVLEAMACNHMSFIDNNIQNGRLYGLHGMTCAQMGNIHIESGIVASNKRGISVDAHPVYGIGTSEMITVTDTHFESNTDEALFLSGQGRADIRGGELRGSPTLWDRANHAMIRVEGVTSTHIIIDTTMIGPDGTLGTGISADSASGLHIAGSFSRLKTIASIGVSVSGLTFGRITRHQIGQGTEFVFAGAAKPYRQLPSVPEGLSLLAITRNAVSMVDDFLGTAIDTNRWILKHGSNGGTEPIDFSVTPEINGIATGVTGGAGGPGTMALNGISMSSPLTWRADKDGLAAEVTLNVSATSAVAICIAFTDQTAALEMPAGYAGTTLTPIATDAFGLIYDTASTNDKWTMFGIANGVAVSKETLIAASTTMQKLRITVDTAGIASFYINGALQGVSELLTNGDFNDSSVWNFNDPSWVWDSLLLAGQHKVGTTSDMSQPAVLIPGQTYTLQYTIAGTTQYSTGSVTPWLKGGTPVAAPSELTSLPKQVDIVAAAGNNSLAFTPTADFPGRITNVSLQQKGLSGAVRPTIPLALVVTAYSLNLGSTRSIKIDEIAGLQFR